MLVRLHASRLKDTVDNYLESNVRIKATCQQIASLALFKIDRKRMYRMSELVSEHDAYRASIEAKVIKLYKEIVAIMRKTSEVFKADGSEIQQQWKKYAIKMDVYLEEALRVSLKKSLQVIF